MIQLCISHFFLFYTIAMMFAISFDLSDEITRVIKFLLSWAWFWKQIFGFSFNQIAPSITNVVLLILAKFMLAYRWIFLLGQYFQYFH